MNITQFLLAVNILKMRHSIDAFTEMREILHLLYPIIFTESPKGATTNHE